MTNLEAVKRFDQAHGAKIDKLFWIAASFGSSDFTDFLEGMDDKDFNKCFPEIYKSEYFIDYRDSNELRQALVDFDKYGLLAEIHIPEAYNFRYKGGKPVGWSVRGGICRIVYVYAETLEGLMTEIERVAEETFQEYVNKDKNKTTA